MTKKDRQGFERLPRQRADHADVKVAAIGPARLRIQRDYWISTETKIHTYIGHMLSVSEDKIK